MPKNASVQPATKVPIADSITAIQSALGATANGLTSTEASARLLTYGPNSTASRDPSPIRMALSSLFGNPLTIILLFAAGVSIWLGDHIGGSIIIGLVAISTTINLVQTMRSHRAVRALQSDVAPTAAALRDGKWTEIPREKVVPGDVVRIIAGDLVPADSRLLEANDLHIQQAALTGESLPVAKRSVIEALESDLPSDNDASVFLGTSVVSGEGIAIVVSTGKETIFGDIATRLATRRPENEFERGLRNFGVLILKTVVFLVFFVFLTAIVLKRSPLESLLFSVALAVGLTPEFLPMITTITLSRGAVQMSKRGVIVKNLPAIQNFGSMDVLCSDKTGTLTSGEMTLDRWIGADGETSDRVITLAAINSKLETGIESGLDSAILSAAGSKLPEAKKLGEAPFDFERRRMSVVAEWEGQTLLICKGASEGVIEACTFYREATKILPITPESRSKIVAQAEMLGGQGYRVLAVASREVGKADHYSSTDETELVFEGHLAFMDPPLPDALSTLQAMKDAGVTVKIISGDDQLVTGSVCQKVGLIPGRIVLGKEIEQMTDAALLHVAENNQVFARVSPSQKSRIILALKTRGHVVGYMGDGINDAPSLHAADIGISVSTAVDVAKDAADIILLKPGLGVLRDGILEGRRAFGNVMKFLLMEISSNFGNMFSMAGAMAFLPFLPMLPTQVLLNNFLYDLSQITIPTDQVDQDMISKPHRWDVGLIRRFMVTIGPISSVYDFLTFFVLLRVFRAGEKEFHTGWFVESLATQVTVILVIRTFGVPWRSRPSTPLLASMIFVVAAAAILPYSPFAASLGFVPLPANYYVFLLVATVTYLGIVELVKRRLFGATFRSGS